MLKSFVSIGCLAAALLVGSSCNRNKETISAGVSAEHTSITKSGNISTTVSYDTAFLSRLINLSFYKPSAVQCEYTFIDNTGRSVPGPSDYSLRAVMYFDSATFVSLLEEYSYADFVSPQLDRNSFAFKWLPDSVTTELMATDTAYHGHPDIVFGSGVHSGVWLLKQKVLLFSHTM